MFNGENKDEKNERKTVIRKNDLKYINNIDTETNKIESDVYTSFITENEIVFDCKDTENLYNEYKEKNKVELRLELSDGENNEFLDLSCLGIDDKILKDLVKLPKIKKIIKKINLIDLSGNKLKRYPYFFSDNKNIKIMNVSNNKISGNIEENNLIELVCNENEIEVIKSNSIERLNANNNKIKEIKLYKASELMIKNNEIKELEDNDNLEYLECQENKISEIKGLNNLKELYIGGNKLEKMSGLKNLRVLNCVDNPIEEIEYFSNLEMMEISTNKISEKYKILMAKKIKNDYYIRTKEFDGI